MASPLWLRGAFASIAPDWRALMFLLGFRRARASGRPLLVLVIPSEERESALRGQVLGALINHGGDQVLATLATVKIVCCAVEAVEAFGLRVSGDPWMLLIETDALPPSLVTATVSATVSVTRPSLSGVSYVPDDIMLGFIANARASLVGLLAQGPSLSARVGQGALAHPEATRDLELALTSGIPSLAQASAAPARMALAISQSSGRRREALSSLLAQAGGAEYRDHVPDGAVFWANDYGCGPRLEDDRMDVFPNRCHVGGVPELSQRFLSFF